MNDDPYIVGALYNRLGEIHGVYGGQQRGGISTPAAAPFVFLFTGEAGKEHGYSDFVDDYGIFHYFGEGQRGDMRMAGGNAAIANHIKDGKRLLLFQMMGKGRPCRYLGEHVAIGSYVEPNVPDSEKNLRSAIVFNLQAVELPNREGIGDLLPGLDLDSTTVFRTVELRRKQDLFRRRLITVEKECRLTGIRDLRFVRASHIKPWSACTEGTERVDGNNGLLLTPTADHLFDRGWITFEENGRLALAKDLAKDVVGLIGLDLKDGRSCGGFNSTQQRYLDFHRTSVFEKSYTRSKDPYHELFSAISNG